MANTTVRNGGQSAAVAARPTLARSPLEVLFRSGLLSALPEAAFVPSVEVSEKDGNYLIEMALPGFDRNSIDIEVSGNEITVSGRYERKQEDRKTHYSEMQQASFARTVVLPHDIAADKVTADFQNGMLRITAPPVAPIAAKKIAIKGETS